MNTAIDPAQRLARWRLILGAQAQERLERMGACGLTEEQLLMDQALGAIYGDDAGADALGGRGAGSGSFYLNRSCCKIWSPISGWPPR